MVGVVSEAVHKEQEWSWEVDWKVEQEVETNRVPLGRWDDCRNEYPVQDLMGAVVTD